MFVVKCIPFVGTGISLVEAIGAAADGDGKGCVAKLAQTAISGGLDAAFVLSGGVSSLATAPMKAGAIEGGKIVGKKALEQLAIQEAAKITTNVAARAVTEYVANEVSSGPTKIGGSRGGGGGSTSKPPETSSGSTPSSQSKPTQSSNGSGSASGSGNDPPRQPQLPKEHEVDEEYDQVVVLNPSNPITSVQLGDAGRVEQLTAEIRHRHLRSGDRPRGYTERVKRFVEKLGRVMGEKSVRESDEVGHIIAWLLGGPSELTYNFFPQSPFCNMEYYHKVEKIIKAFLQAQHEAGNGSSAYVCLEVKLVYADYPTDWPNRPKILKVKMIFSDGREVEIEISNA